MSKYNILNNVENLSSNKISKNLHCIAVFSPKNKSVKTPPAKLLKNTLANAMCTKTCQNYGDRITVAINYGAI